MTTAFDINDLEICYGSLIQVPHNVQFSIDQQLLVDRILRSPHFEQYPPSASFQKAFWKTVIEKLEASDEDIDDSIYDRYIELVTQTSCNVLSGPPSPSYVTYAYTTPVPKGLSAGQQTITLLESRTTIEAGTTGLRTWHSAFALADWLLEQQTLIRGKNVLELGCGSGFLAALCAQIQLQSRGIGALVLTDCNQTVLDRCAFNLGLECNALQTHPAISHHRLDWFEALRDSNERDILVKFFNDLHLDLIIGTDLVYEPSIIPALSATLQLALNASTADHRSTEALIALPIRRESTIRAFKEDCIGRNLSVETIYSPNGEHGTFLRRFKAAPLNMSQDVRLLRISKNRQNA